MVEDCRFVLIDSGNWYAYNTNTNAWENLGSGLPGSWGLASCFDNNDCSVYTFNNAGLYQVTGF